MRIKNSSQIKSRNILLVIQHLGYLKHFEETIRFLSEQGNFVTIIYYKRNTHFSPSVLQRINKIDKIRIIHFPDVINKSQINLLRKMRRTIDSFQYKKSFYKDCPELINRFTPVSKWGKEYPEVLMEFFSNNIQLKKNLTPNQFIEIFSKTFYLSLEPSKKLKKILDEVNPHTIIMSPFLDGDSEPYVFLKYGQEKEILTVYAMASWDNLQNKGVAKPAPDCYLVWTEDHKNQLIQMHDSEEEKIYVVGSEIFELWGKSKDQQNDSKVFLENRATRILYCCSSPFISAGKEEDVIISLMEGVAAKNSDGFSIKMTIKTHPQVPLIELERIIEQRSAKYNFITILKTHQNISDDEISRLEFLKLVDEHDVCIGINTSIMLEAAIQGLPVVSISNSFENLRFPRTLHQQFLRKYSVNVLTNMSEFEEFLENVEKFRNSAKVIQGKMQTDLLISKESTVPIRVFNAISVAKQKLQKNIESKRLNLQLINYNGDSSYKKGVLKSLIKKLKNKRMYIKSFQILRSTGIKSLIAHVRLFVQNLIEEKYEFKNSQMAPLILNQSLLKNTTGIDEHGESANLPDWDNLSSNFASFKIKDPDEYSQMLAAARIEINELVCRYDNIVIGPWFSELGFELLYWIPFINSIFIEKTFANKNVVTISRGGVEEFYSFLPGRHFNLLEHYSQEEWSKITSDIWRDLGGLKQSKLVKQEVGMLLKLKTELNFNQNSRTLVIHPSLMFSLFRPFWRNKTWSVDLISKELNFPNFSKQESGSFGAVKIYSRPSLSINEASAKSIKEFLAKQKIKLMIISSDSYKDDHEVLVLDRIENSILVPIDEYENNLKLQLDVIKKSSVSYTTYGGLSYYALYLGKSSFGFFTDSSKFDLQHLKVAGLLEAKFGSQLILKQIFI